MNNNSTENFSADHNLIEIIDNPTPTKINLATCGDIRREMAKVYREARLRKLPISDATKLSYILTQVLKAYEMTVLESRIDVLEKDVMSGKV